MDNKTQQIAALDQQIQDQFQQIQKFKHMLDQVASERITHLKKRQQSLSWFQTSHFILSFGYIVVFGYILIQFNLDASHPLYYLLTLIASICAALSFWQYRQIRELQQDVANKSGVENAIDLLGEQQAKLDRLCQQKQALIQAYL